VGKEYLIFNVSLSGKVKVLQWDAFKGQQIPLIGAVVKKERIDAQIKLQSRRQSLLLSVN
jgi:hypothetical protein